MNQQQFDADLEGIDTEETFGFRDNPMRAFFDNNESRAAFHKSHLREYEKKETGKDDR